MSARVKIKGSPVVSDAFIVFKAGSPLFHHDPAWLEQRERDQANDRRHRYKKRVADLPAEKDTERSETNQHREPITDGDSTQQDAGAKNRSDRRRIGHFHEDLD